jgi:hypothetical protein
MNAFREREMNRNRLVGHPHFDLYMMVLRQQPKLLAIIVAEQIGPRHGGFEHTGARHEAVRAARIDMRIDLGAHPDERVARAHPVFEGFITPVTRKRVA